MKFRRDLLRLFLLLILGVFAPRANAQIAANYCIDTSSAANAVICQIPNVTAYYPGQTFQVRIANNAHAIILDAPNGGPTAGSIGTEMIGSYRNTGAFTMGYDCAVAMTTQACFNVGSLTSSPSASQILRFQANDADSTDGCTNASCLQLGSNLVLGITSPVAPAALDQSAASTFATALTISSATAGTFTFGAAYTSAPVCTVTPRTALGATTYSYTVSTTAVVVTLSVSGSDTFDIICVGNPN